MSDIAGRVLLIPKGTYDAATTYAVLDVVKYEKNSYVAKQATTGNLPTNTTYWQPLTDVTADAEPTENSTNLVESGGTYSAIDSVKQTLTNYVNNGIYYDGAKNLLPLLISKIKAINTTGSWSKSDENDVYTISGVTYTITSNANGVITNIKASGTGASSSPFSDLYITLRNTYDAFAMYELIKNNTLTVATHAVNSVNFILDGQYNDSWKTVQAISGKADITLNISTSNNVQTCIRIVAGRTVTNEDITPIMAQKSLMDIDDSFSPYAKTNQQLTRETTGLIDNQNVNGAVNMLENRASTQIDAHDPNITWTVNDDGTVTASAPSYPYTVAGTNNAEITINSNTFYEEANVAYRMSGCPSGGGNDKYFIKDKSTNNRYDYGEGVTILRTVQQKALIYCIIVNGYKMTGPLTFKPMFSLASLNLSYDDYVPYAKSNKELTEDGKYMYPRAEHGQSAYTGILDIPSTDIGENDSVTFPNMNGVWLMFLTRLSESNCAMYLICIHTNGGKAIVPIHAAGNNGVTVTTSGTSLIVSTDSNTSGRIRFIKIDNANY